ncbi:hypothetical protein FHQ27_05620 [Testudinibacter sp. TR-2022]|nr:hypothetical protein FHQ29_11030 [Testudinibacter sp. TR-2022]TNH27268.1 hypothetical protein FHQ27_05620 [Testudinibacter sp. TR-2022]
MDNTRILAAREAGIKIQANVHNYNETLTLEESIRFRVNGVTPKTWGEAVELRIQRQSSLRYVPIDWSNKFPYGSIYDPKTIK